MLKRVGKHLQKKIEKHVCKHKHKHVHHFLHHAHHIHHHLGHGGELLLIMGIFAINFVASGFTPATDQLITDHTIIAQNLIDAKNRGGPVGSNIISMRRLDASVENTFYPGYCTYGAARISPEFFPYIDSKTQARTRGGNAKDRCNNAQATGFKVSTTPAQGTLVVYSKIGSSPFGHVGKVMYLNNSKKSMIVRDMNRVEKFIMIDRREETDDSKITCYIYPKQTSQVVTTTNTTTTTSDTDTINTLVALNTDTNTTTDTTTDTITTTNTTDNIVSQPPTITTPATTPTTSDQITTNNNELSIPTTNSEPEKTIQPNNNSKFKIQNLELDFSNISDLAKHFLTQREIKATVQTRLIASQPTTKIGDKVTLTLSIKNKDTQASYEGLLDVAFDIITTNGNMSSNYSTIKLLKNGEVKIKLKAIKIGTTTVILNFGGEKIGKINFIIH